MSKMPPTCTDCHDADATNADGWCDECAALRDDDPSAPGYAPRRPTWALRSRPVDAPMRWPAPMQPPVPAPPGEEPRYRFPF